MQDTSNLYVICIQTQKNSGVTSSHTFGWQWGTQYLLKDRNFQPLSETLYQTNSSYHYRMSHTTWRKQFTSKNKCLTLEEQPHHYKIENPAQWPLVPNATYWKRFDRRNSETFNNLKQNLFTRVNKLKCTPSSWKDEKLSLCSFSVHYFFVFSSFNFFLTVVFLLFLFLSRTFTAARFLFSFLHSLIRTNYNKQLKIETINYKKTMSFQQFFGF